MGDSLFSSSKVEVVHDASMYQDAYKQLHKFQQQEMFCDVVIQVDNSQDGDEDVKHSDWSIQCHRVILACYSDYFKAMFSSDMKESKMGVVKLHDVDSSSVEMLIDFCYTHTISLSVENVQSILYAASVLQMQLVTDQCSSFIRQHMTSSNWLNVREFGVLHGQMELVRIADDYMRRHFAEVAATTEFNSIGFDQLLQLLKSSDLVVDSEKEVYDAVMKWTKHKIDARRNFLDELLDNVRLPLLSVEDLVSCVETEAVLRSNIHCRDLIDEAKNFQLSKIGSVNPTKILIKDNKRIVPRLSYSGFLLIAGGRNKNGHPISSVECYNLSADSWFYVTPMTTERRHVGIVAHDGFIYAVGGFANGSHLSSVERYDVKTNSWSPIRSISKPRRGLGLVSFGETIYAIGGLLNELCYNTVERYDVSMDTWTCVATLIIPRGGVSTAVLDKHIYAVGGNDGLTSICSCEKYDPIMDKWVKIASMNDRRAGAGITALNGNLYVIGGFDGKTALSSVERFDPHRKKWTKIASLMQARGGVGVAVIAGKIYAVGGHDGEKFLNSVEVYDPEAERWSPAGKLNSSRAGAGLTWCSKSVIKLQSIACQQHL